MEPFVSEKRWRKICVLVTHGTIRVRTAGIAPAVMYNELFRCGVISIASAIVLIIDKDYYLNYWTTEVERCRKPMASYMFSAHNKDLICHQGFSPLYLLTLVIICASVYRYVEMLRLGYEILFYNS